MKNILITGGAGFIGSNIALKLIKKGYQVTVLDNLSPQIHGTDPDETSPLYRSIKGKVKFINGTVTSREDWQKALIDQSGISISVSPDAKRGIFLLSKVSGIKTQSPRISLKLFGVIISRKEASGRLSPFSSVPFTNNLKGTPAIWFADGCLTSRLIDRAP